MGAGWAVERPLLRLLVVQRRDGRVQKRPWGLPASNHLWRVELLQSSGEGGWRESTEEVQDPREAVRAEQHEAALLGAATNEDVTVQELTVNPVPEQRRVNSPEDP